MDNFSLILHVISAAVLVGGMILLFVAVTPATWLIEDEGLRTQVTRVVTRRFASMTVAALVILLVTGLYQLFSIVPESIRSNMGDYRFGVAFMAKIALAVLLVAGIAVHAMYYGPRIARLADEVAAGDEERAWQLENLRRASLLISLLLLIVGVAVAALGVVLGNHDFSYTPF